MGRAVTIWFSLAPLFRGRLKKGPSHHEEDTASSNVTTHAKHSPASKKKEGHRKKHGKDAQGEGPGGGEGGASTAASESWGWSPGGHSPRAADSPGFRPEAGCLTRLLLPSPPRATQLPAIMVRAPPGAQARSRGT